MNDDNNNIPGINPIGNANTSAQPQTSQVSTPEISSPSPQPIDPNPVDSAVNFNPLEPEQNAGPATQENQQQTNQIQSDEERKESERAEWTKRVEKKRKELKRNSGKEVTFSEAQHIVLEDVKTEKEQQKTKDEEEFLKNQAQAAADHAVKTEMIKKYEQGKLTAAENNLPFQEDPEVEAEIKLRRNRQDEFTAQEDQKLQEEEDRKTLEEDLRIQQEEKELKDAERKAAAEDRRHQQKVQEEKENRDRIQNKIKEEDEQLKKIDPNAFWNSRSTGQKIAASIGILLSGIGSGLTGKSNLALDQINKFIDDDINAQKLNNDQILARKNRAFEMTKFQLQKMEANTNNQLKKAQISKIYSDISSKQVENQQKRISAAKIASGAGFTREELLTEVDPKQHKNYVVLEDGKFYKAIAADGTINKFRAESTEAKDAIRGLNRLKEILEIPGKEFNLKIRAEADAIQQSLKGALRITLFGPGVMTDTEQKLANKIIANPTKVFQLDSSAKAKLDVLLQKVKQGQRDRARGIGIILPKSTNEKMLEQFMSVNKKISRPEAINALIKRNKWIENE